MHDDPGDSLPMEIRLNAHQRRRFEVLLASVEDALLVVDELSTPVRADDRALTKVRDDLPQGFAGRVAPNVARARARLVALANALSIEARQPSARRTIEALLTAEIVRLQDSEASKLGGYGAVDPSVATALDPVVRALEADLTAIRRALHQVAAS